MDKTDWNKLIRKDAKMRLGYLDQLSDLLWKWEKENINKRGDLFDHLDLSGFNEDRKMLREIGWMALDPWYGENEEWLNAKMIINDRTIREGLQRAMQPMNRDWCNIFFE